ncbi:MAG: methyltransferase domain-containing protein [Phycisphaerales bacterium]|nr:methyltransferase domain-containing protein [Phycisphaerales bacterium]
MSDINAIENDVVDHYYGSNLLERIRHACVSVGIDPDQLTLEQTSTFDEFHIGGAAATEYVLSKLDIQPNSQVLDVGCGIGGPARHIAKMTSSHVTGIDLTPGYIDAAISLSRATGTENTTSFVVGNAIKTHYENCVFDTVVSFHVAMNIKDRAGLYQEMNRVLTETGTLCLYDVLQSNENEPVYPVPWAASSKTSFLLTIDQTRNALEQAGFEIELVEDMSDTATAFFAKIAHASQSAPSPLGIKLLMTDDAPRLLGNLRESFESGSVKPVLMIAKKRISS